MIAIADPALLDKTHLNDRAYLTQTREFLKRIVIHRDTLIVLDKDGVLLNEMRKKSAP